MKKYVLRQVWWSRPHVRGSIFRVSSHHVSCFIMFNFVFITQAREKVKSIAQRAKGINVSKCTALVNELDPASAQLYSETSGCAVDKVKIGSNYVDNMKKNTDNLNKRLSELREEGLRCGNNVTSAKAALQAVVCIELVSIQSDRDT